MSKKMLFVFAALSSACGAETVLVEGLAPEESVLAEVVAGAEPVEVVSVEVEPAAEVVVVVAPVSSTELPGIRIEDGPVSVTPSDAVTDQTVASLAETTAQALEAALHEMVDVVVDEPLETVEHAVIDAIGQGVESLIDFLTHYYGVFVEFFSNGWKYMIYHSVGGAAKHIVATASSRSVVLDLSSLQAVDGYAAECLAKMEAARTIILEAAAAKSPELKEAADACLAQYTDWFTGKTPTFAGEENATRMLANLGLPASRAGAFNAKNLESFVALGGSARNETMYFVVAPNEQSGLLSRDVEVAETEEEAAEIAEIDALIDEIKADQEIIDEIQEVIAEEEAVADVTTSSEEDSASALDVQVS